MKNKLFHNANLFEYKFAPADQRLQALKGMVDYVMRKSSKMKKKQKINLVIHILGIGIGMTLFMLLISQKENVVNGNKKEQTSGFFSSGIEGKQSESTEMTTNGQHPDIPATKPEEQSFKATEPPVIPTEKPKEQLTEAIVKPTEPPTKAVVRPIVLLDVPYINQRERYPTGCESVSAVMALNYLGINITVNEFIDNYLDMGTMPVNIPGIERVGCDPWKAFPGSPYLKTGFGCFAPVIANALHKFIDSAQYEILELYNKPVEELCKDYLDREIPVIFWATVDMKPVRQGASWIIEDTGERVNWVIPMHCLLLVGYDDNFYYFNDPWQKKACAYRKKDVEAAYIGMFSQAIVVKPVG